VASASIEQQSPFGSSDCRLLIPCLSSEAVAQARGGFYFVTVAGRPRRDTPAPGTNQSPFRQSRACRIRKRQPQSQRQKCAKPKFEANARQYLAPGLHASAGRFCLRSLLLSLGFRGLTNWFWRMVISTDRPHLRHGRILISWFSFVFPSQLPLANVIWAYTYPANSSTHLLSLLLFSGLGQQRHLERHSFPLLASRHSLRRRFRVVAATYIQSLRRRWLSVPPSAYHTTGSCLPGQETLEA